MTVTLRPATQEDGPLLHQVFQYYLHDMSAFIQLKMTEEGHFYFNPEQIDKYWQQQQQHWPYLIMADNQLAGFCLARLYPGETSSHDIEQFFILNAFKGKGVGFQAFSSLMARNPGKWIVRVLQENTAALRFWQRAVHSHMGDKHSLQIECDQDLDMHFFRFDNGNSLKI